MRISYHNLSKWNYHAQVDGKFVFWRSVKYWIEEWFFTKSWLWDLINPIEIWPGDGKYTWHRSSSGWVGPPL